MIEKKISALILAAGYSSRMERFKPLLRIGKKTITEHAIGLFKASGIEEIITVVGYRSEELIPVVKAASSCHVINHHYHDGMFSSIQKGIKALRHACEAFFILPVDTPLVLPATVRKLLNAIHRNSSPLVFYPQFQSKRGHPPLISSRLIDQILSYDGQDGMHGLLRRYEDQAIFIPVDDPFIRLDADTWKDLNLLRKMYSKYVSPEKQQ